jgi:apolipoprotein N-acyltransferase
MIDRRAVGFRLAGAAAGLMLAGPSMWGTLAPLQGVALLPILYCDAALRVKRPVVFLAGMYMGLAYTVPQICYLRMPPVITVILLVYFSALMVLLVAGWRVLALRSTVWAAAAAGAFFALMDWVNVTALPMWGTSQSFVRCWSRYPRWITFTSATGLAGIAFVLAALQALAVLAVVRPRAWRRCLAMAAVIVAAAGVLNVVAAQGRTQTHMKVAAVGWLSSESSDCPDVHSADGFETLFAGPVAQAAAQGARLIVSGEMGFFMDGQTRAEWFRRFGEISRRHGVYLAVGCFDTGLNENRLVFFDPRGQVVGHYTKTHLTPFEHSRPGDRRLTIVDVDGTGVGALICQDDNFSELVRDYGRRRVGVMAVPTLDWSTVRSVHLETTIHRAIQLRQACVRAAINGISAIILPSGDVAAKCDHFRDGPKMIIAEVPVAARPTLYARWGDWLVALSFAYLAFYLGRFLGKDAALSRTSIPAGEIVSAGWKILPRG